ncbi:MAG TPA: 23S rRNA pseudouridine(955/2504/2580) synthase [Gammaproteobacteria bacterium]|nr:23S rRNA pseudouridine(955/2504/2580) synthase [Gammaproteobacteria bacterium]
MATNDNSFTQVRHITITEAHHGQRLDNFLASLDQQIPKSRLYKAIRKGEVRVNKGRKKQTYRLAIGDSVRIPPLHHHRSSQPITTVAPTIAKTIQNNILLEDEDLLILNKPPGLAVHAGSNIKQGIIEALKIIRAELPFIELVHRLDRATSGCLLLAKNRTALLALQQQMQQHTVDKRYLTLLKGQLPKTVKADFPLKKNVQSSGERLVTVDPNGKTALTAFQCRHNFPVAQLSEVTLFTGRTHQIRVHAAHLGHPIAGDKKYGDRDFNHAMKDIGLQRLFLHAWQFTFQHPTTQQPIQIVAPLPDTLQQFLTRLDPHYAPI